MDEVDLTEEDEDHEDGIRFATLESRFENKETVFIGKLFLYSHSYVYYKFTIINIFFLQVNSKFQTPNNL